MKLQNMAVLAFLLVGFTGISLVTYWTLELTAFLAGIIGYVIGCTISFIPMYLYGIRFFFVCDQCHGALSGPLLPCQSCGNPQNDVF